ncbi:MAG: two-component regulator propeller domain-containing protein [Melioribacteraceae bacterium]
MKKKFLIFFVIHFFLVLAIKPKNIFAQAIEHNFEKLSVVVPTCVIQDKFGFIWVGSQGGLLRYDGYKFKNYSHIPFDSTSLSTNFITVIKEDQIGNLWIGTNGGGLNYFNQKVNKFTSIKDTSNTISTFERSHITDIEINDDGSIWVGTEYKGLIKLSKFNSSKPYLNNFHFHKNLKPTEENHILDLFMDSKNKLWIGTLEHGLIVFDPTTKKSVQYLKNDNNKHSINCNTISTVCEDSMGNIWIATGSNRSANGEGINRFDRRTKRFFNYKNNPQKSSSLYSNQISSLLIDKNNIMWIGTVGKGLTSISVNDLLNNETPKFKFYKNLEKGIVNSLYEDKTGKIWISTWDFYLRIYDTKQNQFAWYKKDKGNPKQSLSNNSVRCLYIDKQGRQWFGTDGLDLYNPSTSKFKHYSHSKSLNSLNSKWVNGIAEDENGYFWFATNGDGLNRFDPIKEKFTRITPKLNKSKFLNLNVITHILSSSTGNIYIVVPNSGLWLFNPRTKEIDHIRLTSSSEKLSIKSLFEDVNGKLWLATLNEGVFGVELEDKKIINIDQFKHNNNNVNSLTVNSAVDILRPQIVDTNAIWIATTVGLNRFDLITKKFTHFFKEDGLPNSFILKILEDDIGNIWVATAIGIGKYDISTKTIHNFTVADGLPFPGFGGGKQNAAKAPDGQLFFSGGSGAIGFYPEKMKNNSTIPPIILTDFEIYHEQVKLDTSIQFIKKIFLEHSQNTFSIEYVALSYKNSKKNQYAYKLEGFNKDWINSGVEREASFTNIDPGEYLFKVRGSNNLGIWNINGAEVQIIIEPPWWQTWWFRIFASAVLLFGIVMVYITKIKNLEKERKRQELFSQKLIESQEGERKRIAGELHDSLGQNLLIIYNLIQQYLLRIKEIPPELAQVEPEVKETIEEVRKISRNLHPHQLEQLGLSKAVEAMARKVTKITSLNFSINIDFIDNKIKNELWIHVYRIVQEALSNIIKHAKADIGSLEITRDSSKILIEIVDDGVGLKQRSNSNISNGFGLESIKERVRLLNAELNISSLENKGTNISIDIPI